MAASRAGHGEAQIPDHRRRPAGSRQIRRPRPDWRAQFAAARALSAAGFIAEPLALVHGFIVERWLPAAPARALAALPRHQLVARLADYLGFRAGAFPAANDEGAPLRNLVQMAMLNTAERLGQDLSDLLARQLSSLPAHEPGLERQPPTIACRPSNGWSSRTEDS